MFKGIEWASSTAKFSEIVIPSVSNFKMSCSTAKHKFNEIKSNFNRIKWTFYGDQDILERIRNKIYESTASFSFFNEATNCASNSIAIWIRMHFFVSGIEGRHVEACQSGQTDHHTFPWSTRETEKYLLLPWSRDHISPPYTAIPITSISLILALSLCCFIRRQYSEIESLLLLLLWSGLFNIPFSVHDLTSLQWIGCLRLYTSSNRVMMMMMMCSSVYLFVCLSLCIFVLSTTNFKCALVCVSVYLCLCVCI